jgi:poly(A) polymerase
VTVQPTAPTDAQRQAASALVHVPEAAEELGRLLSDAGHELHLVGGSVRDALLGRVHDDLDFATDATPEQVLMITAGWAEATWETGVAFGTVGLARQGMRFEVTTFRTESYEPGSRKPDVAYGDTLAGDLSRRDFTVNAMALALPGREFTDLFGGLRDLADRRLRTPVAPESSFDDDPLRMLRAARFVAQLRFTVDPDVVAAMAAMAERITIVSAERIRDELRKLLLGSDPVTGLRLLVDTGLAGQPNVLPELPGMRLAQDSLHRHKDVYEHSLAVLQRAIDLEDDGVDLVLRTAALLHDIGKPATRAFKENGVSFHHHEVVGAKMARKRLRALAFPKAFIDDVCRLIELHLRFHGFNKGEWSDSAVRRYANDAGELLERLHKLTRSDCTTRNPRKAQALATAYDELERRIAVLAADEELKAVRPDLDGNEIMTLLALPPGPLVGQAWRYLKEQRLERGPIPHDEAVALLRQWAATNVPLDSPPGSA